MQEALSLLTLDVIGATAFGSSESSFAASAGGSCCTGRDAAAEAHSAEPAGASEPSSHGSRGSGGPSHAAELARSSGWNAPNGIHGAPSSPVSGGGGSEHQTSSPSSLSSSASSSPSSSVILSALSLIAEHNLKRLLSGRVFLPLYS